MKIKSKPSQDRGLTLIEVSLVIGLILTLVSLTYLSFKPFSNWQKAKDAGISLQAVYTAQKTYLADHPTQAVDTLTDAQIIPYLPNNMTAMPTAVGLNGEILNVKVTVIPPTLLSGGSNFGDPSGSTTDGLWDAGKQ
ncbi:MAG: hypothetical protein RL693_1912 [Verrucomicrobiota bacterium]|jgi:prepilin-type N-terminal cleavage/methylation domain-containing protein